MFLWKAFSFMYRECSYYVEMIYLIFPTFNSLICPDHIFSARNTWNVLKRAASVNFSLMITLSSEFLSFLSWGVKWTVSWACCRSRRWSLWQNSLKVNPGWNTRGDPSWAEVAILEELTARPSARAWRHCWSMTVNNTLPGVWCSETNHLHYTVAAFKKKKEEEKTTTTTSEDRWSVEQPCTWVAVDQNPINHCLVLRNLPVIACWLMKLKHSDATKARSR